MNQPPTYLTGVLRTAWIMNTVWRILVKDKMFVPSIPNPSALERLFRHSQYHSTHKSRYRRRLISSSLRPSITPQDRGCEKRKSTKAKEKGVAHGIELPANSRNTKYFQNTISPKRTEGDVVLGGSCLRWLIVVHEWTRSTLSSCIVAL